MVLYFRSKLQTCTFLLWFVFRLVRFIFGNTTHYKTTTSKLPLITLLLLVRVIEVVVEWPVNSLATILLNQHKDTLSSHDGHLMCVFNLFILLLLLPSFFLSIYVESFDCFWVWYWRWCRSSSSLMSKTVASCVCQLPTRTRSTPAARDTDQSECSIYI